MDLVYLLLAFVAGGAIGFLVSNLRTRELNDAQTDIQSVIQNAALQEAEKRLTEERNRLLKELSEKDERVNQLNGRIEASLAKFQEQEKRLVEQKLEFEDLNKRFNTEFENLANKILDEKSKKFADQNKENLEVILKPLRENIEKFEKKVEEKYDNEQKERASLKGEIKVLHELNKKISEEAHNLTTALKGDSKKQGNWGELILERILENSGLIKGEEYFTQQSTLNDAGNRIQPDVVIQLPDDKQIIIDSKVSLVAYERFVNADELEDQERFLKEHVASVKRHINELFEKNYHTGKGLNSPEFVLMFMPIESSFSASVRADDELFNYAWDKRIVIVSPSTLLATLRTVASIWKQDRQTKNALDIAEKSGRLYDKFVGFIEDMQKIGDRLQSTQKVYDEGMKKLSEGSGNLVRRAEELKKMGAKANKQLPNEILGLEDEDQ